MLRVHGRRVTVTADQTQIIKPLEEVDKDISAVQAPAMTEKTFIISLYLGKLLEDATLVVTAPTNLLVQETAKTILRNKPVKTESYCFRGHPWMTF